MIGSRRTGAASSAPDASALQRTARWMQPSHARQQHHDHNDLQTLCKILKLDDEGAVPLLDLAKHLLALTVSKGEKELRGDIRRAMMGIVLYYAIGILGRHPSRCDVFEATGVSSDQFASADKQFIRIVQNHAQYSRAVRKVRSSLMHALPTRVQAMLPAETTDVMYQAVMRSARLFGQKVIDSTVLQTSPQDNVAVAVAFTACRSMRLPVLAKTVYTDNHIGKSTFEGYVAAIHKVLQPKRS